MYGRIPRLMILVLAIELSTLGEAVSQQPPPQPTPAQPTPAQQTPAGPEGPAPSAPNAPAGQPQATERATSDVSSTSITPEMIAEKIKEIESQEGLDAELKKNVVDTYKQAQSALERGQNARTRAASYKSSVESAPKTTQEIRDRLKQAAEKRDTPIEAPTASNAADLAVEVKKLQADIASAKSEVERKDGNIAAQQGRPATAREEQTAARTRLEDIEKQLKVTPAEGESKLSIDARQTLLNARRQALTEEIAMLEQEILSHPARLELLQAERGEAALALTRLEARLKTFQEVESGLRAQEAEAARLKAEQEQREAVGKHPAITKVAEENTRLSDELTKIVNEESAARPDRNLASATAKQLDDVYKRIKSQIEAVGVRGVGGPVLRERRKQLPDILRDNRAVAARWSGKIAEAEARRFRISVDQHDLQDLDTAIEQRLKGIDPTMAADQRADIAQEVRTLLVSRKELLTKLDDTYEKYIAALRDLETAQSELGKTAQDFARLLDEWLLWIPSSDPPSVSTLTNLGMALLWVASPENWVEAGRVLTEDFKARPVLAGFSLLICIALFVARPRLYRRYGEIAKRVGSIQRDTILHTLVALALSLIVVLPIPLAAAFVGWRLRAGMTSSVFEFAGALGMGLLSVAALLFALRFFSVICGKQGVAEVHFRWRKTTLELLRRHLAWLVWVIPVTYFFVSLTEAQTSEEIRNSLGRLAFVLNMGALGVFIQRVVRPHGALMAPVLARYPDGWLSRLRFIWYPLAVGVPLALAVIAAAGYYYTAVALESRLTASVGLIIGAILLQQLGERWLLVAARRLAVEKAREARRLKEEAAKAAQAAGQTQEGPASEEVPLDIPEVDMATVNDQTRRLMSTAVDIGVLFALWGIWASVLPALGILDAVVLWKNQILDETGALITQEITLQNMVVSIIAVALTVIAARNLPGALEIAVLKNLPLEAGMRYALATVSQYIVTVVGIIISFQVIGIGWAKVQWLVAALSVGIGFGLQEIIANFFCGLILLFERPIRIGDIVKVGDVMGTVSRIRIRATTITDWDRMDYIVPNKELITGRLLNWTLSNTINRIVINVGIAYGADPEKARELLLKIADEHPLIMKDPGPLATFEAFGDSALSVVLRCYLPDFANRLGTINELHSKINKAFKEAGIEIAFPQLDLHLRSSDVKGDITKVIEDATSTK